MTVHPIPLHITETQIYELFDIPPVDIRIFPSSKSLENAQSSAVIVFDSRIDNRIIERLRRKQIDSVKLKVQRGTSQRYVDLRNKTKWIKMTNLSAAVTIHDIRRFINEETGTKRNVKNVYLYPHAESEKYAQFAFIECADAAFASLTAKRLRGKELKGMRVWATWSGHKVELSPRLELKGRTKCLAVDCNGFMGIAEVRKLCARYGDVDNVRLIPGTGGYTTGLSVVTMQSVDDAVAVYQEVNGRNVDGINVAMCFMSENEEPPEWRDRLESMDCRSLGFLQKENERVFVVALNKNNADTAVKEGEDGDKVMIKVSTLKRLRRRAQKDQEMVELVKIQKEKFVKLERAKCEQRGKWNKIDPESKEKRVKSRGAMIRKKRKERRLWASPYETIKRINHENWKRRMTKQKRKFKDTVKLRQKLVRAHKQDSKWKTEKTAYWQS